MNLRIFSLMLSKVSSRAPNKEISSALSGGLDSTSLSFLIEKINKKYNLHPISIKFNEVDEIKIKSNDNLFIDLCSPLSRSSCLRTRKYWSSQI